MSATARQGGRRRGPIPGLVNAVSRLDPRLRPSAAHSRGPARADAGLPPGGAWAVAAVIVASTALVYSNTLDASFHFDDATIVTNASLRDLRNLWPPSGTRWVGLLSFALNYQAGGLEVLGYHLANILIHVCNGLLVAWLAATTMRTQALREADAGPLVRHYLPITAGLLFALHPLATQAVTYVVQRFASLATLFFLLSLLLHVHGRLALDADEHGRARAAALQALSFVAACAAMKTKEIAFTLPLVAAGYEFLFFRAPRRPLRLVPLAVASLLVPLGMSSPALETPGLEIPGAEISRSAYLLTQSRVVLGYLRLLVWPAGQNLDHDIPLSHSILEARVLLAVAALGALAGLAIFLLVRGRTANRAPGVLFFFGVAWFFVTVSVESSIVTIADVMVEHRVYLPAVGAAIALGTALLSGVERLRLRLPLVLQCAAALIVTAAPIGVATYRRNFVWKDDITLWSDAVAKSPNKARPHNFLGRAHLNRGEADEAVREFQVALQIRPWYPEALMNLGRAWWEMRQVDDALRAFRAAARLSPGLAMAHNNLGAAYEAKGRTDDAIREFREALRLAPGLPEAQRGLARVLGSGEPRPDAPLESSTPAR